MTSEDRLREELTRLELPYYGEKGLEDIVDVAMQWHKEEIKKLVPEERNYYDKEYGCGYEACRNEILKSIEDYV